MEKLRVLFLGDIVGITGRMIFKKHIARLREEKGIDAVIVNGENSAHGRGITSRIVRFFKSHGVDVITSGNHIWHQKEIYSYLANNNDLLRPANFSSDCPGVGVTTFECKGYKIGIINLQGRVFMRDLIACPFRTAESILTYLKNKTNIIFVDFHAEATSEKLALSYFLDGQISGFVGTHTHIQTADERVLPGGSAHITDLGMSGSLNSMLGMKKEPIMQQFRDQMPIRFVVDTRPPMYMTGALIDVNPQTGKALSIERINIVDDAIDFDEGAEE